MGGFWLRLDYAHRQRSRAKQAINYESISYHDLISGRGGEEEEEERKGVMLYSGKAHHTITPLTSMTVGVRIYPLTLAMALA